jgi:transposase
MSGAGAVCGLHGVMGFNFIAADREQSFLLPPDVREWLPEDHLAWLVLDATAQLDLDRFRSSYRADGHGRAAYDPALMVALLLFAYCDGVSSSREIERRCERDVAYRVVAANQRPDHATLARFRARHREAIAGLFVQVLGLCSAAGMVRVGVVAIDGTRLAGNASSMQNRTRAQLEAEIAAQVEALLATAEEVDAGQDAEHGEDRGDEPPPRLRGRERRRARLAQVKAGLDAEEQAAQAAQDQRRRDYDAKRAAGVKVGRPPGAAPPHTGRGERRLNVTDPDSKVMKGLHGWVQGYNGQVLVSAGQLILAQAITNEAADYSSLHPLLHVARANLNTLGNNHRMRVLLGDSGYGGRRNLTQPSEPILLIATNSGRHKSGPKKAAGKKFADPTLNAMQARLTTPAGRSLFRRRAPMVEPVFAQIKNRLGHRLRTRGLANVTTEWDLITTSHNLLKYFRHTNPAAVAGA